MTPSRKSPSTSSRNLRRRRRLSAKLHGQWLRLLAIKVNRGVRWRPEVRLPGKRRLSRSAPLLPWPARLRLKRKHVPQPQPQPQPPRSALQARLRRARRLAQEASRPGPRVDLRLPRPRSSGL